MCSKMWHTFLQETPSTMADGAVDPTMVVTVGKSRSWSKVTSSVLERLACVKYLLGREGLTLEDYLEVEVAGSDTEEEEEEEGARDIAAHMPGKPEWEVKATARQLVNMLRLQRRCAQVKRLVVRLSPGLSRFAAGTEGWYHWDMEPSILEAPEARNVWLELFPRVQTIIVDPGALMVHPCVGQLHQSPNALRLLIQPVFSQGQVDTLVQLLGKSRVYLNMCGWPAEAPRMRVLWRWNMWMLHRAIFYHLAPASPHQELVLVGETLSVLLQGEVLGPDTALNQVLTTCTHLKIMGHTDAINADLLRKIVRRCDDGTVTVPNTLVFSHCVMSITEDIHSTVRALCGGGGGDASIVPDVVVHEPVSALGGLKWVQSSLEMAFANSPHAPEVSVMDTARGRHAIQLPLTEDTLFMHGALDNDRVDMYHSTMRSIQGKVEHFFPTPTFVEQELVWKHFHAGLGQAVGPRLHPHQRVVVEAMERNVWQQGVLGGRGMLVNHDTGSGKTWTAVVCGMHALWTGRVKWAVVVCPKAVQRTWIQVLATVAGTSVARANALVASDHCPRSVPKCSTPGEEYLLRWIIMTPGMVAGMHVDHPSETSMKSAKATVGAGAGAGGTAPTSFYVTVEGNPALPWSTQDGSVTQHFLDKALRTLRSGSAHAVTHKEREEKATELFCGNTQSAVMRADRRIGYFSWGVLRGMDVAPLPHMAPPEKEEVWDDAYGHNPHMPCDADIDPNCVTVDVFGLHTLFTMLVGGTDLTLGMLAAMVEEAEATGFMQTPLDGAAFAMFNLIRASPGLRRLLSADPKERKVIENVVHAEVLREGGATTRSFPHCIPSSGSDSEDDDGWSEEEEGEEDPKGVLLELGWALSKAATVLWWPQVTSVVQGPALHTLTLHQLLGGEKLRTAFQYLNARYEESVKAWLQSGGTEPWSFKLLAMGSGSVWLRCIHFGPRSHPNPDPSSVPESKWTTSTPDPFLLVLDECHMYRMGATESKRSRRIRCLAAHARALLLLTATTMVNTPAEVMTLCDLIRPGFSRGIRWAEGNFCGSVQSPLLQAVKGLVSVHMHTPGAAYPRIYRTYFSVPMDDNQQRAHDILAGTRALAMHGSSTYLVDAYAKGTEAAVTTQNAYHTRTRPVALCHFHLDRLQLAGVGGGMERVEGCVAPDDPTPITQAIVRLSADGPTPSAVFTPFIRSGVEPLMRGFERLAIDHPDQYLVCIMVPTQVAHRTYRMVPERVVGGRVEAGAETGRVVVRVAALISSLSKEAVECVHEWHRLPARTNERTVLIFTGAFSMGVRFRARQFHKAGQSWHDSENKQLEGRLACMNSHAAFPEGERELFIFHWMSTMHDPSQLSADQHLTKHVMTKGHASHYLRGVLAACSVEAQLLHVNVVEEYENTLVIEEEESDSDIE